MNYYEIAPTKIVRAHQDVFTYSSPDTLELGTIVIVPIGSRSQVGVVWQKVSKPTFITKPITSVLESVPIPAALLALSEWLAQYYVTPLALVLQTVLPAGLQKKRRPLKKAAALPHRNRTTIVLNRDQKQALRTIEQASVGTVVLRGVTGSGKTRIYIEAAKKTIKSGRSVIILVPEIALSPQLVAEFRNDFRDEQLLVTHSQMTEAERHLTWRKALYSQTPLITIGPRSALFAPVPQLGLIVIDESHEPSFKQDQSPKYSAIRAAAILSNATKARLILGSATPNVADYYLANKSERPIATLPSPAIASFPPQVELVSFLRRSNFSNHRFFSNQLLQNLQTTIKAGHQALIFHNRRGSASLTVCSNCGWSALCPRCFVPLSLHIDSHTLRCHLCGYHQPVPHICPVCQNPDIIHKGVGTKMIADELERLFPKTTLARFDADNSIEEALQTNYQALYDGDIQLIVGTQLIAKGLDLPHLQLVGVVQADNGLFLPDYQAEERVFQLLYQVAGRVGRQKDLATTVVIQTFQPQHPVIQFGLQQNYEDFYNYIIGKRKATRYPPFRFLMRLTCRYATEAGAIRAARSLAKTLADRYPTVEILGPTPAFYERLGGDYRWQLLVRSRQRRQLQAIARHVPKPWQVDLDPYSLL